MFDFSWGEVMLIGGVALVFIPPKDLPKALRTVGQMTTKVRRMASEFQGQLNEALREAELDDVRREVQDLNRQVASATASAFNPIQKIRDELKSAVTAPIVSASTPAIASSTLPAGDPDPFAPHTLPVTPPEPVSGMSAEPAGPVEEVGPVPQIEPIPAVAPEPAHPHPEPATDEASPGLETAMEMSRPAPHDAGKGAGL